MIRTVAAVAIAAIAFLLGVGSAGAQTDAQDRCIETAVSNLLADPLIKRDTFYWFARLSAAAAGQPSDEPAPSGPISIEGITAPLSYADVQRIETIPLHAIGGDRVQQRPHGFGSLVRIRLKSADDDAPQPSGYAARTWRRRDGPLRLRSQQVAQRRPGEGSLAVKRLVQGDAEAELVTTRVGWRAQELLKGSENRLVR